MSITRLKQARQMRKGGGVMGSNNGSMLVANTADGSRPGYGGPQDWGQEEKAKTARATGKTTAASNPYAGAGQGSKSDSTVKDDGRGYTTETQDYNTYNATGGKNPLNLDIVRIEEDGPTLTPKEKIKAKNQNLFYDNKPKYPSYIPKYIQAAANFNRKPNRKYYYDKVLKNNAQNLNYTELEAAYKEYMDNRMAGYTDAMGNTHPNYRLEGDTYVENDRGGGANQPIISNFQSPIVEEEVNEDNEDESSNVDYTQNVIYENYGTPGYRTTRAEGGIMGTRARRAMGGIMERVDKRQQFFLGGIGKAIGKVAKAAGKVLSSDVGKMALTAAAFYYGGGGKFVPGGSSTFKMGNFFSTKNPLLFSAGKGDNLGTQVFNPMKFAGLTTTIGALAGPAKVDTLPGFSDRGGKMKDSKGNEVEGPQIRAEIDDAYESGDPERIAAIEKYYAFLPPTEKYMPYEEYGDSGYRTTVATGGRIGFNGGGTTITLMDGTKVQIPAGSYNSSGSLKDRIYSSSKGDLLREEIVRKLSFANGGRIDRAEGGLMDLGGMEKDYRAEGGFVPIGEYEKKDDVPARLSVNEFVMTADAVRGAGQGDIDKGAEIMENMMKNLENGGTISKESQGNKGAQNMFKTSERLGAVI
jgi:hypothetical protein